jgi:ABC-2 type transport system permease protein
MNVVRSIVIVLTLILALVAFNLLAARHPLRVDLTEHHLYTLAPATRALVANLDDVVTVRVYFSRELPPQIEALRRDVDDVLAEFKSAARGKLQVEQIDPGATPAEEERAVALGIPPVQLNVYSSDKAEVAKIFLGMAVLYGGKQQVIPVVRATSHLEYDLAEAIVGLTVKERPTIGWWEPEVGSDEAAPSFRILKEDLSRRYTITEIQGGGMPELSPEKIPVVILASLRRLTDEQLFALDQYLVGGGSVMALVDRVAISSSLQLVTQEIDLLPWLAHAGVTVEDAVVADPQNAMAAFSGGAVTYHVPYPYWPEVRRSGFDRATPAVADLEAAVFPWTSPLSLGAAPNGAALAMSTAEARAVPRKDAKLDPASGAEALRAGEPASLPLAVELAGPFTSFFATAGHKPPRGLAPKIEGLPSARLFVAGSSRWADDRFLQTFPQNAILFENVLDSFAMGETLVGIRSREALARPIADLSDASRAALRYVNVAFGPIALAIIALVAAIVRRVRISRIMARYQQ